MFSVTTATSCIDKIDLGEFTFKKDQPCTAQLTYDNRPYFFQLPPLRVPFDPRGTNFGREDAKYLTWQLPLALAERNEDVQAEFHAIQGRIVDLLFENKNRVFHHPDKIVVRNDIMKLMYPLYTPATTKDGKTYKPMLQVPLSQKWAKNTEGKNVMTPAFRVDCDFVDLSGMWHTDIVLTTENIGIYVKKGYDVSTIIHLKEVRILDDDKVSVVMSVRQMVIVELSPEDMLTDVSIPRDELRNALRLEHPDFIEGGCKWNPKKRIFEVMEPDMSLRALTTDAQKKPKKPRAKKEKKPKDDEPKEEEPKEEEIDLTSV